jgi:tRNA dimethylallyltransferase
MISAGFRMAARNAPRNPLIAIIGATGTGKSQLAVELASRFNGEIINSDAIQMYTGLPIITNKITVDEQKGIPHHLLGSIGLDQPTWTVGKFVRESSQLIEEIKGRGKVPIVVGGTHYYLQALLFPEFTVDDGERDPVNEFPILERPTETLLEELRKIDPTMAERWHPQDRRKIRRSLEIYLQTGKKASDLYDEQKLGSGAMDDVAAGMNHDVLVFWPHVARDVLKTRLDARVLKMVEEGLIKEIDSLDEFRENRLARAEEVDQTRGIWVAIGYKEFENYRNALKAGANAKELEKLEKEAVERVQAGTRQYARRQLRWIQYKLLSALTRSHATEKLFVLDGSDLSQWDDQVSRRASDLTRAFLSGDDLPDPRSLSSLAAEVLKPPARGDLSHSKDLWEQRTCDICQITTVMTEVWQKHVLSKRHKKAVHAAAKRRLNEENGVKLTTSSDSTVSVAETLPWDGTGKEVGDGDEIR